MRSTFPTGHIVVVAIKTCPRNLRMIDGGYRNPDQCAMTGGAVICCWYVRKRFTAGEIIIVTVNTFANDLAVVNEISRHPH